MKKTRVLILGAGISGLSLAFYLKSRPDVEVVVLEKEQRAGGYLHTERLGDVLFERGPRTFSMQRSQPLLKLIGDLGLTDRLIFSSPLAKKRYIYSDGALRSTPWIMCTLLPALMKEWRVAPCTDSDETIFTFARRRFGEKAARHLFDPMTLGIYAGDIHELSMKSCFPTLKKWEEEWGSVTRGFLKRARGASTLFSLEGGAQTLIDALVRALGPVVHLSEEAQRLCVYPDHVEVYTETSRCEADLLFSTLPPPISAALFAPHDAEIASMLRSIPMKTLHVVGLNFHKEVHSYPGFGYLVPTSEEESVLGAVFDSCIFPQKGDNMCLSVMVRGEETYPLEAAQEALKRHLKIMEEPAHAAVWTAKSAIPQYKLGHEALIHRLEKRMGTHFPRCRLLGNYLRGVSVNDCVATALSNSSSDL